MTQYALNGSGSLTNGLYHRGEEKPEVGMGATQICWTDRRPFTVIAVSESGKTVTVREDTPIRVDSNGMSECQSYRFEPNPEGIVYTLRMTKRGWAHKGQRFSMGRRDCYHDYSF